MFNRRFLVAVAVAGLAFTLPAGATLIQFTASLTGANEAPPNASTAVGSGTVTFDDVALTVAVNETFVGLSGPATGSHIHCCTATPFAGTAAIVVDFISAGFPLATSGSYANTFNYLASPAFFNTLLAGSIAGRAYLNIHDAAYPGGEIRGFLTNVVSAVPEPGTVTLMLAGLAGLGWAARRRRPT